MLTRSLSLLLILAGLGYAQHKVDSKNTYSRVICVVPIVGKGTAADPRRPQYAPWPPPPPGAQAGIIAWSHQLSDDGKSALVEFVARNRTAFQSILNDKSITVFGESRDSLNCANYFFTLPPPRTA